MFTISYSEFVDRADFSDFMISYMPGLRVTDMSNAKVVINIDERTAYVYID